jgi:hypothetical protein
MNRFFILLVLSSVLFSQTAMASEITSKNGNDANYIQVLTSSENGQIELGFRFCTSEPTEQTECDAIIGEKPFYNVKDLIKQRHKQEWEVFGTSVLDPAIIAGTIAGGAVAGGFAGVAIAGGSGEEFAGLAGAVGGLAVGGAIGAAGGGILIKLVHALNPFYHLREAKIVSKALLSGEDIQVMSVEDYAKELAAMLHGIR